jgi:hypothetical protein
MIAYDRCENVVVFSQRTFLDQGCRGDISGGVRLVSERNIKCVKIGCGHQYSLTCGSISREFVYDELSRTPFEMRACVRKKPGRGRKIMQNFIDSQESRTNNLN